MKIERLEHKLGIKASDTAAISFIDCRIPAANLLGHAEIDVAKSFAGVMETFDNTRPLVAAMAIGCFFRENQGNFKDQLDPEYNTPFTNIEYCSADLSYGSRMGICPFINVKSCVDGG